MIRRVYSFCAILVLTACGDDEEWTCRIDGQNMYSTNESGELGSADKGCSCEEIRSFELRTFGEVDEEALQRDFRC
jgi:hypothetical protein